jgi:hypothetical protein
MGKKYFLPSSQDQNENLVNGQRRKALTKNNSKVVVKKKFFIAGSLF